MHINLRGLLICTCAVVLARPDSLGARQYREVYHCNGMVEALYQLSSCPNRFDKGWEETQQKRESTTAAAGPMAVGELNFSPTVLEPVLGMA